MSYDILLYDLTFLKRALSERNGDWTDAPELPEDVKRSIVATAEEAGFRLVPHDPGFVAFAAAKGHTLGAEYRLDSAEGLAQLTVFSGSASFSIPSSARAAASITLCRGLAENVAASHSVGVYDPQSGELLA